MIPVLIEVFVPGHIRIPVVQPNQTSVHSRCQRISSTPQTREFHQRSQISTSLSWKYSCATKIEAQQILLCLSICHLSFHIVHYVVYTLSCYMQGRIFLKPSHFNLHGLSRRRNSSDKAPWPLKTSKRSRSSQGVVLSVVHVEHTWARHLHFFCPFQIP